MAQSRRENATVAPGAELLGLSSEVEPVSSHLIRFSVDVPKRVYDRVKERAKEIFSARVYVPNGKPRSVSKGIVRVAEEQFGREIDETSKIFILRHAVIDYVVYDAHRRKLPLALYPRLSDVFSRNGAVEYNFELSIAERIDVRGWELFSFVPPRRKRYKDLDKQVENFIRQEHEKRRKHNRKRVENRDWVKFACQLVDRSGSPVLGGYSETLWMRVDSSYVELPFHKKLLGKVAGDTFFIEAIPPVDGVADEISNNGPFKITVLEIIKGGFVPMESIRHMFRLRSRDELHAKLIEVFSYRNDVPQRKAIVEELFMLMFSRYRFEVPTHLITRRVEEIVEYLRTHPDYLVYKSEKKFLDYVASFAEETLRQEMLMSQIAYSSGISVTDEDIRSYIALFNNHRSKDLVYFHPTVEPLEDMTSPIRPSTLASAVLREKALNYVLKKLG